MPLLGRKRQIRGHFKAIAYKLFSPLRIESESIFLSFKLDFYWFAPGSCRINVTNALSFYKSQNVLCQSNFF